MRKKQLKQRFEEQRLLNIANFHTMRKVIAEREQARTLTVKLEQENAMLTRSILFAIHATDDGLPNIAHSQLKYAQTQINGWKE